MRGINKVILVGSLGADPLNKHFTNGSTYAQFSIATSEKYQDKNTGNWIENTEWHRIVALGRLGEIACQFLKKVQKFILRGLYERDNGPMQEASKVTLPKLRQLLCSL